jgi:hypothetical protein
MFIYDGVRLESDNVGQKNHDLTTYVTSPRYTLRTDVKVSENEKGLG